MGSLAEPEGPRPATGKSKIAAKKKPGASSNVMTKRRKLPEPVKYRADKAVPGVPWPAAVFKFKYRSLGKLT